MKYKNYTITREDERNWKLTRLDSVICERDTTNKRGGIVRKKGDQILREVFKGFHSNVGHALSAIAGDLAGKGCDDIQELAEDLKTLKKDLQQLCTL